MKLYKALLIFCVLLGSAILLLTVITVLPTHAMPLANDAGLPDAIQNNWVDRDSLEINILSVSSPTGTITYTQHLPVIFGFGLPAFELADYWTADSEGMPMLAFRVANTACDKFIPPPPSHTVATNPQPSRGHWCVKCQGI